MMSLLEALPNEILDFVLENLICHEIGSLNESDHIQCSSLSRLSQCSHSLKQRLEPLLYKTFDARDAALRNGCMTGNLDAIRKAAVYGSNLDAVRSNMYASQYHARVSPTLQVALKAGQLEAFKLLLEFGVGIKAQDCDDENMISSQLKAFARRLAEPSNEEFLKAFISARAETPYWKNDREDKQSEAHALVSRLSFPRVVQWGSPALLETLLDHGAHLNETCVLPNLGSDKKLPVTPLGAACLRGDLVIFNLLVARGAHVNIQETLRDAHPATHTHVPIFMAAQYMGKKGIADTIDACVAAGADINQLCHDRKTRREGEKHVCTTPLLTYLSSIESWNIGSSNSTEKSLTPFEGITHFFNELGARMSSPIAARIENPYSNYDKELHDRTFAEIPSPVELLLTRMGIESLAIPEFFSVIRLLVEHGGTGPDLARLLVRLDGQNDPSSNVEIVDVEGLWKQFLELLMPQLHSLGQAEKDALLRRVIVDKGRMRHRVAHPSHWINVKAIGRASISALVRVGANINHVLYDGLNYHPTSLHKVASNFVHTDCLTEDHLHEHPPGYDCAYTRNVIQIFGDFLAFLVSEGADPLLENPAPNAGDEKTPVDTLLSPIRRGRIKHEGGTVEQGLLSFIARLQGQSKAPAVYTGDRKPYRQDGWATWRPRWNYSSRECDSTESEFWD